MLDILRFFKFYNKKQILQTKEQHHALVVAFLTFALCITFFGVNKNNDIVKIICYIRVIDIIIHNIAVAFFDKYNITFNRIEIIENISSYKRMAILNILVSCEMLLYLQYVNWILICIAFIPTSYLLFKCLDKFIEKRLKKEIIKENEQKWQRVSEL